MTPRENGSRNAPQGRNGRRRRLLLKRKSRGFIRNGRDVLVRFFGNIHSPIRIESAVKQGQILIFLSFLGLIAIGTLLLKLPCAMRGNAVLPWIDALFTATSASCVTGLTTVNTADFSFFGKAVITLLMEIGGIGIITLSTAILIAFGKRLSCDRQEMIAKVTDCFSLWGSDGLFVAVIIYTLTCEAIGFVVIYTGAVCGGHGWLDSIGESVMLSVAGFCNAGFAPFPDNMTGQPRLCQLGCALLGIFGGLGVFVVYDLLRHLKELLLAIWKPGKKKKIVPVSLHTRIMLWGTAILLFGGMFLLFAFEKDITLFDAFFMSASSRTAGFYCCDIRTDAGYDLITWLMTIGGGSGGTAGGVKITTIVIIAASIINTSIGNREVYLFKRTISRETVTRSFAFFTHFLTVAFASCIWLEILYPQHNADGMYFEIVSALSTTGLSVGIAEELEAGGKAILCLLMYTGRVGPMTFLLFLFGRENLKRKNYPKGDVAIG